VRTRVEEGIRSGAESNSRQQDFDSDVVAGLWNSSDISSWDYHTSERTTLCAETSVAPSAQLVRARKAVQIRAAEKILSLCAIVG